MRSPKRITRYMSAGRPASRILRDGRGELAPLVAGALLVACTPRLTDRTEPATAYVAPLNYQTFAADITVRRPNEVRRAFLEFDGDLSPMRRIRDERWEAARFVRPCYESVPYRFIVDYDDERIEPYLRQEFPEAGHFTRRITGQPPECRGLTGNATPAFVVNTTDDLIDARPGDGICSTTVDTNSPVSRCSLRAAVMESNRTPGLNIVQLSERTIYRLTRTGAESDDRPNDTVGDLDITDALVIETDIGRRRGCPTDLDSVLNPEFDFSARGLRYRNRLDAAPFVARIDANGIDRVLDIYRGPTTAASEVQLNCLHITGGRVEGPVAGPAREGGGIRNRSLLLLIRVVVTQNAMSGRTDGAGIHNSGRLVFRESALLHNVGSTNGAFFGGTTGGGLYNSSAGAVSIENSLLAFNVAALAPGIFNDGDIGVGNSTITDHDKGGDDAAGALAAAIVNSGSMRIAWSTIRESNSSVSGPGNTALLTTTGEIMVGNSLLFSENPRVSARASAACSVDGRGRIVSQGGNWASPAACLGSRRLTSDKDETVFHGGALGSRILAMTLEHHGGFTPTLALREPRPTPEHPEDRFPVDPTDSGLPLCAEKDQRGFARPVDGDGDGIARCDPGAFEFRPM